jgi:hypothetical protein
MAPSKVGRFPERLGCQGGIPGDDKDKREHQARRDWQAGRGQVEDRHRRGEPEMAGKERSHRAGNGGTATARLQDAGPKRSATPRGGGNNRRSPLLRKQKWHIDLISR